MLTNTLMTTLAFKALTTLVLIPVWILLALLFRPTFDTISWSNMLLTAPVLIIGFAVNFLLTAAITCIAFWTQRVWALYRLYGIPVALFSGQFVPLNLMPKVIQEISVYLPFQLFKYFPTQMILGKLSTQQILQGYLAGIAWIVLALILFRFAWRRGLKHFSAVGA